MRCDVLIQKRSAGSRYGGYFEVTKDVGKILQYYYYES